MYWSIGCRWYCWLVMLTLEFHHTILFVRVMDMSLWHSSDSTLLAVVLEGDSGRSFFLTMHTWVYSATVITGFVSHLPYTSGFASCEFCI